MSQTSIFQDIAEVTGIAAPNTSGKLALPANLYPAKSRIALIGTVGAGKSTVVGGVGITAETLVRETQGTDHPFYCQVLEGGSEIHQDKSDLRGGHFPRKTQAYTGFSSEAGLLLEWEKKYGPVTAWHKYLQVPICDMAGEDIQQTIRQVVQKKDIGTVSRQKVANLIGYMRESDGYLICLKGTRAKGFNKQLEPEKDTVLSSDPDVNMVRLLQDLVYYKMNNNSRPIRGIAVIVTASDVLQREIGDDMGFDITRHFDKTKEPQQYMQQQKDLTDFVASCFPATYAAIVSLRVPNVQFFPSYFQTETDIDGTVQYWEDEPDSPKIMTRKLQPMSEDWRHNLRKINYSEAWYIDIIEWLRNFAANA